MDLRKEAEFFKDIAAKVRKLVVSYEGKATVAKYKDVIGDFATEVDVAVEKLIAAEIKKRFPQDHILAEEEHNGTEITDRRIWIIDPICGTTNIGHGITAFCTNIALAENQNLIAACVVDHSQEDYFWSIGDSKVYVNDRLVENKNSHKNFGKLIDLDIGASLKMDKSVKQRLCNTVYAILLNEGYMPQSFNTSLGFAYTAIGKVDGFINVHCHPWDICAASFLIQQAGGVITDLEGKPWQINSDTAIGALDASIHKKLVEAYNS